MLTHEKLLKLHDKAFEYNQTTRENSADDMVFYWVTQWDDNVLGDTQLQYRGEFNVLRKAGRQIIADLRSNPIQVDFDPKEEDRDDGADLIDGLYRACDRINTSIESYDNASGESVVCGVGAWELHTEYESNRAGNQNQVIRRRPIHEANNNCFWDPNAKLLDKSDAGYCSVIVPYSRDGLRDLIKELTGEDSDDMSSFAQPEQSYSFPWIGRGSNEVFYVSRFYHVEEVNDKVLTLIDPFGQELLYRESDVKDVMDELKDQRYKVDEDKTRSIKRTQPTLYISTGREIIKSYKIAGEHIPVIPVYGERAFIEGEEHYEGVTRLAKDPQRLRNFMMSYVADIASQSPRPMPIFFPEQIAGFEHMYDQSGSENRFPFLYQNRTADDQELPIGPVAQMPEQSIPTAVTELIGLTQQAVTDVADPGLPGDIADIDLSGKAVAALQNRLDQQSIVYQQNLKHAKRRDGEIYASMAADVYDAPRKVTLALPDGTKKKTQVMESVMDAETGELKVLNDLTGIEFDVYADIGPSYSTKKEQTQEQLNEIAQQVIASDPALHKLIMLKQIELTDGINVDDLRDYANKQLVMAGVREPETDEEKAMLAEAQENQQPDANTLLAQAEMEKAKADQAKVALDAEKTKSDAALKTEELKVASFNAVTARKKADDDTQIKLETERLKHQREMEKMAADHRAKIQDIEMEAIRMSREQQPDKEEKDEREEKGEKEAPVTVVINEAAQPTKKKFTINNTPGGMQGEIVAEGS